MHPYLIQAISAERVAERHRESTAWRLARQARMTARRPAGPGAAPARAGGPAALHRAWARGYRQHWDASFERLDAHLHRVGQELERLSAPAEQTGP